MRILLFLCLSFNNALAAPFIEGGKAIPKKDKYKYFTRIETTDGYSCSATKVSKNKLITAAHCVIDRKFNMLYNPGDQLLSYGKVKEVQIHPKYIQAKKNVFFYESKLNYYYDIVAKMDKNQISELMKTKDFINTKEQIEYAHKKNSQSDIAFIILDSDFGYKSYPQIINKGSDFNKRGNIEIVGYGTTKKTWNSHTNEYSTNDINLDGALAISCWNSNTSKYEPNKLSSDIIGILSFKAKIEHSISNNNDYQRRSKSMLMPGDSGSSAIEYDKNNKQIITAIASTVGNFVEFNNNMSLKVTTKDGKEIKIKFPRGINNWGDPQKNHLDFIEVVQKMSALGLYKNGNIADGVKISREYSRESEVRFADLLHPENQIFIRTVMEKEK